MDAKSVLVGVAIGYVIHYAIVRANQPNVNATA